jgi:hypothetical protein
MDGLARSISDWFIVGDYREWFVKVVEHGLPFLILRRLTKADHMVFKRFPTNEKDVFVLSLNTVLEFMRHVAWHRSDDDLGFQKRSLEFRRLSRPNVEGRNF